MTKSELEIMFQEAVKEHQSGRIEKAGELYREILKQDDRHPETLHLLGVLHCQKGLFSRGVALIRKAIELRPGSPAFHYNLANGLLHEGLPEEAIVACREALRLLPSYAEAQDTLELAFRKSGRIEPAVEYYRIAFAQDPENATIAFHFANILKDHEQFDDALAYYRKALALNPSGSSIHNNLANMFHHFGKLQDAVASYRNALTHDPGNAHILLNLAIALKDQGRIEEAIGMNEEAVRIDPDFAAARSNLLFTRMYLRQGDQGKVYREHLEWAAMHAGPAAEKTAWVNRAADPCRKLRIGYVSPDFRAHPVAYFIESILESHNRSGFAVYCYANVDRPDAVTERLKTFSDCWRDISGLPDGEICELIRRDRIDILVDLAGHTTGNSLGVFSHKPAPIQVTYLGYPNTTGLETIDYRMTDLYADPEGADRYHVEKLVRLPGTFLCYKPPQEVTGSACRKACPAGPVTFGSFNNRSKISPDVISAWSGILRTLPDSTLVIKARYLADEGTKQYLLDLFAANGIDPGRIETAGPMSLGDHFDFYRKIDIALDTFPYNGTTTTCEALWMGVPVIVLEGYTHVSRVGVSILSTVGLTDLIARSPEEYVRKAVDLAMNRERLATLHAGLRELMKASPLMDAAAFTKTLEAKYRWMWQQGNPEGVSDDSVKSMISHGEELFAAGSSGEALEMFRKVILRDPDNVCALNNLGVIYWQTGEKTRAIELFQRALELEPGNPDAQYNLEQIIRDR